jgi:hypothetical protein
VRDPIEQFLDGRRWLVWDPKLFRVAYDLADAGADAIARALDDSFAGFSIVSGFAELEIGERYLVVSDARRIHAIITSKREAAA